MDTIPTVNTVLEIKSTVTIKENRWFMLVRKAVSEELDSVFMMGFDRWKEEDSKAEYLNRCRNSPKYQKGDWFILVCDDKPVSSLIVYKNSFKLPHECYGIGSIATTLIYRNRGYASYLIKSIVSRLMGLNARGIYLFSDIEHSFYIKLGFILLNKEASHSSRQCMVQPFADSNYLLNTVPEYF